MKLRVCVCDYVGVPPHHPESHPRPKRAAPLVTHAIEPLRAVGAGDDDDDDEEEEVNALPPLFPPSCCCWLADIDTDLLAWLKDELPPL